MQTTEESREEMQEEEVHTVFISLWASSNPYSDNQMGSARNV